MAGRAVSPVGAAEEVPTYAGGTEAQIEPPMPPGMGGAIPDVVVTAGMPGAEEDQTPRARAQRRLRRSPFTRRGQLRLVQQACEFQEAR